MLSFAATTAWAQPALIQEGADRGCPAFGRVIAMYHQVLVNVQVVRLEAHPDRPENAARRQSARGCRE